MSETREPPRRHSSMEITLSIPRDRLPPISQRNVVELGLDPSHPETLEGLARAGHHADTSPPPTMDRCPACEDCGFCRGTGMVNATQKAAFTTASRDVVVDEDEIDLEQEPQPPSAA